MTLINFCHSFVVSLLILSLTNLFPHARANQQVSVFCLLLLCALGYLCSQLFNLPEFSVTWLPIFIAGNLITGAFWLTCQSLFGEQTKLQSWQWVIAFSPLLSATIQLFSQETGATELFHSSRHVTATIDVLLVTHAMLVSINYWRDDLVEERRTARAGVLAFTALFIITDILIEQILALDILWLQQLKAVTLAVIMFSLHRQLLAVQLTPVFEVKTTASVEPQLDIQNPKVDKIIQSMEQQKLYRQEGMTIGSLASELGIQEYKLRKLINHALNFRNFNDFLNHYRIKEASAQLSDPQMLELPVLTIALDVGFRSLSSFNKAFKETHEMTPTQYRKQNITLK